MRRDVAVMLVVHLLPLQSLALLAHTGQSSLATGSRAAAYTRMKNPLPVGTSYVRRCLRHRLAAISPGEIRTRSRPEVNYSSSGFGGGPTPG